MAIFSYKGITPQGKEIKSTVSSESLSTAKQKLKGQGIMLMDIKEQKSESKQKKNVSFGGGINIEDLSLMTRQLATLIRAKIQIVEAFSALMDQTENPKLRVILSEIRGKVNEGTSLAGALADYPKVFNNVYVNMVEAGEQSGTLEVVLLRLAEFTEAQKRLKGRIQGALTYPILMMVIGISLFGVIFTVVIPKITKIFISMKKKIPWTTQLCIDISDFLRNHWLITIIGIIAFIFFFKRYISSKSGREWWHKITLKIPQIGTLITMINVSRFCSTLATLLNSSVPILTSMQIVKNLIGNVHMQAAVEESRSQIQEGASMTGPLIKCGLFPPMVTHMIRLGERSGELEPMLKIVSENYEEAVNNKLTSLTALLEPIMMIFMGAAVGFVVFSVVVPMMELNSIGK